jgi:hypothetical protein
MNFRKNNYHCSNMISCIRLCSAPAPVGYKMNIEVTAFLIISSCLPSVLHLALDLSRCPPRQGHWLSSRGFTGSQWGLTSCFGPSVRQEWCCIFVDCNSPYLAWGFLAAAYHVGLSVKEVVINILFYALLGTLIHSAGCVINDMLDRDFDRKVGGFQSCFKCNWSVDAGQ